MLISEAIAQLQDHMEEHGDIPLTQTATTLPEGYARDNRGISDVFESTVETLMVMEETDTFKKRIKMFWQM